MRILINSMTQEEIDKYLMRVVECAFREGVLWAQCGGNRILALSDAIKSAQLNIVVSGNL